MPRRALAVVAAILLVVGQAQSALAGAAAARGTGGPAASAPIGKGLLEALDAKTADKFVVEFASKADLRAPSKVTGHAARGKAVMDALKTNAGRAQAEGLALAKRNGARATSFWLVNEMVVQGDSRLAKAFAQLRGVTSVRAVKEYPLVKPVEMKPADTTPPGGGSEWGIEKIRAPEAWDEGILGQGVVVGSVDTGVDFTHPAIVNQYRGNNGDGSFSHDYNWWDPTGICGDEPCDNAGHGTHTMGTMVGGDGPGPFTPDVGVAPGARWISAKGCEDFGCSEDALLSSGQWILAPTDLEGNNPDPSMRPDVVNNSWGSGPGDPFYLDIVQGWRAAGIIPVFSSGNPGPFCGEGGSPGDFLEVFSAGATDIDDNIADFSGRGPSVYGKVNPDISAPGVDVVSSVPGGGYESFSGTSMAAPHTSGTIALILSGKPVLIGDPNNYTPITDAIRVTAVDRLDDSCGGDEDGDPNNVYGDGRIDAKEAVDLIASGGTLAGTVTDDGTDAPVPGAQVTAHGGFRDFTVTTDNDGEYQMFLAAGTYNVSADAFGYASDIASDVEIAADETTTQDFALVALPRFKVRGHVRNAETAAVIRYATVTAIGTPVPAAVADTGGFYQLTLPVGTYTLRANAGGCTESGVVDGVQIVNKNVTQDFALGRKLDAFGHGCRPIAFNWTDAKTDTALFGDDFAGRLKLPFAFKFYGESYTQLFISDNGYLTFGGPDQFNPFPTSIPSDDPPNAAIYPLWRDLFLGDTSQVAYNLTGLVGARKYTVEFTDVGVRGSKDTVDFEVKLYETGERLDILYGNNPANPGDGRGATIGIENADGTDALEFSFSDSLLTPNSAFRYEPMPSGIIRGTIRDENDLEPIKGATVKAVPGLASTTTAADGTYSLRVYPGTYQVSYQAQGYKSETISVPVPDGVVRVRNRTLAAPIPTADPPSVEVELDYGADPVTRALTLGNDGGAPLVFEAKERSRGSSAPPLPGGEVAGTGVFSQDVKASVEMSVNGGGTKIAHPRAYTWTAAHPAADMSVLVYVDDPIHAAPDTYVDQALQRLGLSYTAHYEGDFDGFQADLTSGEWDLVIFDDENYLPFDFSIFDDLNAYVENGGRLVFATWVVDFEPDHPLFTNLGFGFSDDIFEQPQPVFWWQPDHPAFTFPEEAPEQTDVQAIGFGINGQRGDPLEGATAIGGYTTPGPDDGQATLILANEERTAFRGFFDAVNDADLDGDDIPDGVELWENLAFGIGQGFFTDVPWLSESPQAGTVGSHKTKPITLTIGDASLAPGEYRGTVVFQTNAPKPRTVSVDVTLTVTLPESWGGLTGVVTDAHTDEPIGGVDVTLHSEWNGSPLDQTATTDADGGYTLLGPSGTWSLEFAKGGYVGETRDEEVEAGATRNDVNAALHQDVPHGVVEGGPFHFVLTDGRTGSGTITLTNPAGHEDLTFEVGEVNLDPQESAVIAGVTKRTLAVPSASAKPATSTKGLSRPSVKVPPSIHADGDVLASWPAEGVNTPWGVGFTGNVWLSNAFGDEDLCGFSPPCMSTEFQTDGTPTGNSFESDWIEAFGGDMAYDAGRDLLWQVNVGGDNGIYGLDPSDGSVQDVITGSPWDNVDQRGLAYDPGTDTFYIGGWNEGVVYHIAGLGWPTPGETLDQCNPADPNISGLAWNSSFGLLWEATNSDTDTIYLLDPANCDTLRAIDHPSPGFNGAGLELDAQGNLWTVSQNDGLAYNIESGLPTFSDVPWMTVEPESGSVAPDSQQDLTVTVDATGLEPGVHRGIVILQTNDPALGNVQVPVVLTVPAYQQGINAGGAEYTDPATGVVYATDQSFFLGSFGYAGGSTGSTATDIAGTTRDALYQDQRLDMSAYRFTVPNGIYQVDLNFAEIEGADEGDRVFSVWLEGTGVMRNLDVVEASGGPNIAYDRTFLIEVTDGRLDISFDDVSGLPIVNAILVTEVPTGSP
ncbi:MAG TPA: carboxypeptidase regulatory-like domain-containing protein [Candidatus Limnocylindrales bacterium]|nr:carboxypeptidase regulatory-like domain-containing protein [Candidatus Limnocylindrales bacterium]